MCRLVWHLVRSLTEMAGSNKRVVVGDEFNATSGAAATAAVTTATAAAAEAGATPATTVTTLTIETTL